MPKMNSRRVSRGCFMIDKEKAYKLNSADFGNKP